MKKSKVNSIIFLLITIGNVITGINYGFTIIVIITILISFFATLLNIFSKGD